MRVIEALEGDTGPTFAREEPVLFRRLSAHDRESGEMRRGGGEDVELQAARKTVSSSICVHKEVKVHSHCSAACKL